MIAFIVVASILYGAIGSVTGGVVLDWCERNCEDLEWAWVALFVWPLVLPLVLLKHGMCTTHQYLETRRERLALPEARERDGGTPRFKFAFPSRDHLRRYFPAWALKDLAAKGYEVMVVQVPWEAHTRWASQCRYDKVRARLLRTISPIDVMWA